MGIFAPVREFLTFRMGIPSYYGSNVMFVDRCISAILYCSVHDNTIELLESAKVVCGWVGVYHVGAFSLYVVFCSCIFYFLYVPNCIALLVCKYKLHDSLAIVVFIIALEAHYDLDCVESAVKPSSTNQPVIVLYWFKFISCCNCLTVTYLTMNVCWMLIDVIFLCTRIHAYMFFVPALPLAFEHK